MLDVGGAEGHSIWRLRNRWQVGGAVSPGRAVTLLAWLRRRSSNFAAFLRTVLSQVNAIA